SARPALRRAAARPASRPNASARPQSSGSPWQQDFHRRIEASVSVTTPETPPTDEEEASDESISRCCLRGTQILERRPARLGTGRDPAPKPPPIRRDRA